MINDNSLQNNIRLKTKRTGLNDLLVLYEINFLKLKKLLPDLFTKEKKYFCLPEGNKNSDVVITVERESKFTSRLIISQSNFSIKKVENLIMEVAIYHDLKMVEVRRFNGKHQFWSRNLFPNKNMLSKDEKFQWNKYLSEWLSFSRKEGLGNIKSLLP
jgi:uncharacterized protein YqiB (DUF1249 family)